MYFAATSAVLCGKTLKSIFTMGRTTEEQKDDLRKSFLKKLDQAEESVFMRVQLHLKGEIKRKFIEDLRKGDFSINKHGNLIFKSYYR